MKTGSLRSFHVTHPHTTSPTDPLITFTEAARSPGCTLWHISVFSLVFVYLFLFYAPSWGNLLQLFNLDTSRKIILACSSLIDRNWSVMQTVVQAVISQHKKGNTKFTLSLEKFKF